MSLSIYKAAFYRTSIGQKTAPKSGIFNRPWNMVEAAGLTPTNTSHNAGGSYAYAFVSAFLSYHKTTSGRSFAGR